MSYGLQVLSAGGTVIASSPVTFGTVHVDVVPIPTGAGSYSRSYSVWTGRTGLAIGPRGYWGVGLTYDWTYPSGVPTLTVTRAAANAWETQRIAQIFVFVQ